MKINYLYIAGAIVAAAVIIYFVKKRKAAAALPSGSSSSATPTSGSSGSSSGAAFVNPNPPNTPINWDLVLYRGIDAKPEVKILQAGLNIAIDGIFGQQTADALYNARGLTRGSLNQIILAPANTTSPALAMATGGFFDGYFN